jgi:carbonic anhydrase/acetyltransferase-like protein (isoleucine patch superfamily)
MEVTAMLVEHRGVSPKIDPTAWIAPNAVVSGAVTIGAGSRVLYGAVLTADGRAPLTVGAECVIMENAVLRAAGRYPLTLGDRVLVGPHAHLSGCTIGSRCYIATGAMVFNGARLGETCMVALDAKVHIDTELADNTFVPMGFIAYGRPGQLHAPEQAPLVHEQLTRRGFLDYVFGPELQGRTRAQMMDVVMTRYTRSLGHHEGDRVIDAV